MTDDQALERGADAGWALGLALKDCLPDKSEIAIKAAIAALMLMLAAEPAAACHRFSVWHYPWPQRCGVLSQHRKADGVRPAPARMVVAHHPSAPVAMAERGPDGHPGAAGSVGSPAAVPAPPPAEPTPQAIEALRLALDALMLKRAGGIPPVQ